MAHAVELTSDPGLLAADHAERIRRQVGPVAAPVVLAHSGSEPLLVEVANAGDVDTRAPARQPPRQEGTF